MKKPMTIVKRTLGTAVCIFISQGAGALADSGGISPGAITDLVALAPGGRSLRLTWTAPADAIRYRVFLAPNDDVNNGPDTGSVEVIGGVPSPGARGAPESMTIGGLTVGTPYWFLVDAYDADGFLTQSNIAQGTPVPPDGNPPASIGDLVVTRTDVWNNVFLRWTAPGDDGITGTAAAYDVRISTTPILTDEEFASAPPVQYAAFPSPAVQPVPAAAGTVQTMMVSGIHNGLQSGVIYWFAIRTADEVPNWSAPSNSPPTPDVTRPSDVTDLLAHSPTSVSITLSWTAPGDDGSTGTASAYDVRYSDLGPILTDQDFNEAMEATGEPVPSSGEETFVVTGLNPGKTFWFALKAADEASNWSSLSSVAFLATEAEDRTPPAAVTDLAIPFSAEGTLTMAWTAPGDDGSAGKATIYDLRYSAAGPILTERDFEAAVPVTGEPAPAFGLESMTLPDPGLGSSRWFALRSSDEVSNWSALSNTAVTGGSGGNTAACGGSAAAAATVGWIWIATFLLNRRRE